MVDLLEPTQEIVKGAVLSSCGRYRYRLTREWGVGPPLPFVMLNPSTADAELDDPTIRRCIGFARREGAGGIVVVNLYAWRATCPKDLPGDGLSFGPDNERHIREVLRSAPRAVCAWGAGANTAYAGYLLEVAREVRARLFCLGTTKEGHPRHPLYVRADQPLVPFPSPSPMTGGRGDQDAPSDPSRTTPST